MAGKKKFTRKEEPTPEEIPTPKQSLVILKPYIDTITKDTIEDDIKADKLPATIRVRFIRGGTGDTSNRYLGKSGIRYDFNGGVPVSVSNNIDKIAFILKARKNPGTWEIVK